MKAFSDNSMNVLLAYSWKVTWDPFGGIPWIRRPPSQGSHIIASNEPEILCRGSIMATTSDFQSGHSGFKSESGPLFYEARSWNRTYQSLHPSDVVHWVPVTSWICVCDSASITDGQLCPVQGELSQWFDKGAFWLLMPSTLPWTGFSVARSPGHIWAPQ